MAATETITDDLKQRVSRLEGGSGHFATKADLAQLEMRVVRLEERMEARFAELEARMEARFAQMQTLIAQQENRLFLKFGGLMVAAVGVAVAVIRLLG